MKKQIKSPHFEVDTEVEFEVAPDGYNPRWILNRDMGYTDKWSQGLVTSVSEFAIEIFAFFPDGHTGTINFPNWGSSDFENNQWSYPGYLRTLKGLTPICDCGCDGLGYHWNFCKVKKWEEKKYAL